MTAIASGCNSRINRYELQKRSPNAAICIRLFARLPGSRPKRNILPLARWLPSCPCVTFAGNRKASGTDGPLEEKEIGQRKAVGVRCGRDEGAANETLRSERPLRVSEGGRRGRVETQPLCCVNERCVTAQETRVGVAMWAGHSALVFFLVNLDGLLIRGRIEADPELSERARPRTALSGAWCGGCAGCAGS